MKKKFWFAFSLSTALIGVMALQACGKQLARVSTLYGLGTGAPATSVPAGKSVAAVNPALLATFTYQRSGCRAQDGSYTPVMNQSPPLVMLTFSDRQVISDVVYASGCRVTQTFSLLGIDSKTIAVGSRMISVTLNGEPDYQNQCASVLPPNSSVTQWSYDYQLVNSDLSIFTPPSPPCQDGEKDEDIYFHS